MIMKSLALAAALALTPAAAGLLGFSDSAQAQNQGGGGFGGSVGPSGGSGATEGYRGIAFLGKVPDNQARRPNDPPTIGRRAAPANGLCALQYQPNHRMECAPY